MTSVKKIFSDLGLQRENLDHSVRKFAETKKYFAEECEMVFVPTDGSYATKILENVQSLGWEGFVKHPGNYVAEIVLEFYANINKSERTSKIGGKIIPFNSAVLNDLYKLKDVNDEETKIKTDGKDEIFLEEAFKDLCPDGIRSYYKNSWSVAGSCMLETARTWGKFVSSRLVPYQNTSNYNLERVMLLYAIKKNLPINIRRIISNGIITCRFSEESKSLFFPSTITHLAEKFNVDMSNFTRIKSNYAIDQSYIATLQPPRGIERKVLQGQTSSESPEIEIDVKPVQREAGISSVAASSDALDCLHQILQTQGDMARNWDMFKKEQMARDEVLGARMTHLMTELAQTRTSQNTFSQTLENQLANTSPTIQMMGNLIWNVVNAIKCSNIPNFQPYSVADPGVNSFHGEHTGYYQSQEFSVMMAAPPPTIFSERGEAATLVPMPYRNQIFSDVPSFHGFDTIGSPSNLFNDGPSVPPRRPELGNLDDELDFFQYNGTRTSNTDT